MTEKDDNITRRTLLKGTAATGALAGLTGTAAGEYRELLQEFDVGSAMQEESDATRRFTLLGIVSGWMGVEPGEVDARSNPTLRLVEGEEHEVFWINGDGNHHNFNLQNEDGDVVTSTEIVTEQEGTQTVTFTAEPDLEEYFCAPHPVQMRGPIEIVDSMAARELRVDVQGEDGDPILADVAVNGPGADGNIHGRFGQYEAYSDILTRAEADEERGLARFDALEDGTYTVTAWTYGHEVVTEEVTIDGSDEDITVTLPEVTPGEPEQVYELTLEEGQWRGEAPEDIADESNPTLSVTPGETYRVEWTNSIGRKDPDEGDMHSFELPGHNFVVARESGSTIKRSEFLDEEGETQTVDFVAEENLDIYMDQAQLDAIGEIEVEPGIDPDEVEGNVTVDDEEPAMTTTTEDEETESDD